MTIFSDISMQNSVFVNSKYKQCLAMYSWKWKVNWKHFVTIARPKANAIVPSGQNCGTSMLYRST